MLPWARAATAMGTILSAALVLAVALSVTQSRAPTNGFAWLGTIDGGDDDRSDYALAEPENDVREISVDRGDTLSGLLIAEGADPNDAKAITSALSPVYDPTGLRGGQTIRLTFEPPAAMNRHGRLAREAALSARPLPDLHQTLLVVELNPRADRAISVRRDADGSYHAEDKVKPLKAVGVRAQGVIEGSLYLTAKDAGIPDGVIVDLIRIYSHAVDFQREVRRGDHFDVLYTKYIDESGETIRGGAIDYAELTLSGDAKPLFRYTTEEDQSTDYFTPQGTSGKRFLMRTPIDGARLTSGYGLRLHPVLGYTKMHKGVDFSAPTGTPIMAAGNGVVEKASWFGTFGRYVRLKHGNTYKTAYAHMSRFAPGISEGARVRQGQVIGYVGTSGRSTGPHLHYEVMADASQINPMDVKVPTGTSLSASELVAFKLHADKVRTVLDNWGKEPALVAQGEILRAKLLP